MDIDIDQYMNIVMIIVRQLKKSGYIPIVSEDYIQAGRIGLWKASLRFDKTKGAKFETYASIRVRGEILDCKRSNTRLGNSRYRTLGKMTAYARHLNNLEGIFEINWEHHAQAIGLTANRCYDVLQKLKAEYKVSLEIEEDGYYSMAEPDDSYADLEQFEFILKKAHLSEKETRVMTESIINNAKLREIGIDMGVTESRICQIRLSAIDKLTKYYSRQNVENIFKKEIDSEVATV